MNIYELHREQYLPVTIEAAWDFFSMPGNLQKITPAAMRFEILTTHEGIRIFDGMKIRYKVRPLMNIPISWETEILKVNAPGMFMDKQIKGPYALWEHTHIFEPVPGGVKMTDKVIYALPWGVLGVMAHGIAVRSKLEEIFEFRRIAIETYFGLYEHQ